MGRIRSTRQQRAWYFYDWANSAYVTTTATVILGPYLTSLAVNAACPGLPSGQVCTTPVSLLGVPVLRPQVTETTALGAAYLAGIGVGLWESRAVLTAHWQLERRFEPALGEAERKAQIERWRAAVEVARRWHI